VFSDLLPKVALTRSSIGRFRGMHAGPGGLHLHLHSDLLLILGQQGVEFVIGKRIRPVKLDKERAAHIGQCRAGAHPIAERSLPLYFYNRL